MEIVSATSRLLVVQPGGLLGVRVITPGNPLAEVVVVLLQTVQRIQLAVAVFIGKRGEVVDPEIDTNGLLTGSFSHLNFGLTDEVEFPFPIRPDGPHLLDVLDGREINVGSSLELTEDEVRPVVLKIRSLWEPNTVVLSVEFEASGFERHR